MGKVLWNKQTGEAREYEGVDAREILANSPDLYTDVNPSLNPADPDGDGFEGAPQNVADVENEFRREPVGDNPPAPERDVAIIRNPVTDTPAMAPAPAEPVDYEAKTVSELRELAEGRKVDLGDATKKADIVAALQLADEA